MKLACTLVNPGRDLSNWATSCKGVAGGREDYVEYQARQSMWPGDADGLTHPGSSQPDLWSIEAFEHAKVAVDGEYEEADSLVILVRPAPAEPLRLASCRV